MEEFTFKHEMDVRDYECDMQGIVNNSVYQNYLEHTRHQYLKAINLDFADLTARGINLVVKRIEIDYQSSLKSGDKFVVDVKMERISPLRFGFRQNIYRLPDQKLIVSALVIGTSINEKGRPFLPDELVKVFGIE
ncbi:MAG: 4-hydroxybenzoyl-CoA thioesterase [Bacteroidetes bacterium HGW-Bacteroidetes-17]|jgi:acyl-CoA thioester hydrolase|nr:MAG: 4-hydroxybenzoyl-CoA thioesterase [Bacteroidetes bacterium HGW-Bacteroidetes-17]